MKLERYRPTMTAEVLHSWAADADAEIERLRGLLANAALQVVRADTGRAQIVAAERERCAKLCDDLSEFYQKHEAMKYPELKTDAQTGADQCAYAIRNQEEKPAAPT